MKKAISKSILYIYLLIYVICLQATQLIGSTLLVRKEDRPELEEGEFYTPDLVGMKVVLKVYIYYHIIFNKDSEVVITCTKKEETGKSLYFSLLPLDEFFFSFFFFFQECKSL